MQLRPPVLTALYLMCWGPSEVTGMVCGWLWQFWPVVQRCVCTGAIHMWHPDVILVEESHLFHGLHVVFRSVMVGNREHLYSQCSVWCWKCVQ